MNFGKILSRAWQIVWKHKILWLFGILASCGRSGGVSGGNSGSFNTNFTTDETQIPAGIEHFLTSISNFFSNIKNWQIIFIIITLILVFFVIWVLAIVLSTIGKTALVLGAKKAEEGAHTLSLRTLFTDSLAYFWRILGLNLLISFALFLLGLLFIVPIILFTIFTLGIGLLCILPLLCLAIPIGWAIQVYVVQANNALIIENIGIFESLSRGWIVLKENFVNLFLMGLILFIGAGIIGFLLAMPMLIILVPTTMLIIKGSLAASANQFITVALLGGGLCFVSYLPILILLHGILQAFISTSWTLTYLELTRPIPAEAID